MPLRDEDIYRRNLRYPYRYGSPYARTGLRSLEEPKKGWWDWGNIFRNIWPWESPETEPAPFWMEQYLAKPFATTVTAPFSPAVPGTKDLSWYERERQEYEQWKAPWGVKGLAETAPFLAIPGFGGMAAKAGGFAAKGGMLGTAGRAGVRALTPLARGEFGIAMGAGKVAGGAGKVVGAVAKPLAKKFRAMPNLRPIDEIITIASRPDAMRKFGNLPVIRSMAKYIGGPAAVADTPVKKAIVGRGVYELEGSTKALVTTSFLDRLGPSKRLFGLDDLQRIQSGPLRGTHLHEIATYPQKYMSKLTPNQRNWVKTAIKIEDEIAPFLKRNGININQLTFDEGGRWSSRRVVGRMSSKGDMLDVGFISAGPGKRPGLKTVMEKTRIFSNIDEATTAGYKYMSWEDALRFNVQAAYNRVANENMGRWLLERIPYRTTAAPHELKIATEVARITLNKARRFQGAINRAIRGEKLTEQTISSLEKEFGDIGLRGAIGNASTLRGLKPKVAKLLSNARQKFHLAEGARARARERAMVTTAEEAVVPAPAFAGKILTGSEAKATAQALRDYFTPQLSSAIMGVNRMNAVGRTLALAGDASPFGIQLIFLPFTNPKAFVSSMKGFVRSMFDPLYQANLISRHAPTIARHPDLIITARGATEATEAMVGGGWLAPGKALRPQGEAWLKSLGLLPGRVTGKTAGAILRPFQRGYEGALDTAGLKLAESMEHLAKTPAQMVQLDAFINEFRGLFSQARLGMSMAQRQGERAWVLAPQYNRAIGSLLVDAARGAVGRGGLRGKLARDALAKGIVGMMSLTVAVSMLRGETVDEAVDHLNPASKNFMTWDIAGQRIGPGSKVRSVLRLLGRVGDKPESIFEMAMWNPGLSFIRGNLAPVAGTTVDLLTGENFIGDPTRDNMLDLTKAVVGENMVPIWLQSLAYEGGDVSQRALRGAVEFGGGRAYPEYELTPEQIQDRAYREIEDREWARHPKEYRDIATKSRKLDKYASRRLLMQYPGIVMAMSKIDAEKKRWLLQNRRFIGTGLGSKGRYAT